MQDSMCGPSTGLKRLEHFMNEDRSGHQDRLVNAPHGAGQIFRSNHPGSASGNAQFAAFQGSGAPIAGFGGSNLPTAQSSSVPAYNASGPHNYPPTTGSSRYVGSSWVNDFQCSMNLNDAPSSMGSVAYQGPNAMVGSVNRPQGNSLFSIAPTAATSSQFTFPTMTSRPGFSPQYDGFHPQFNMPSTHNEFGAVSADNATRSATFQNHSAPMSEEQQQALDEEFNNAMDAWMQQNGPITDDPTEQSSEAVQASHSTAVVTDSATHASYHEAAISPSTESLTESLVDQSTTPHKSTESEPKDTSKLSETELARTAQLLVNSVSDNTSEKFQNSKFLKMMREIASQQLVVEGNQLVEHKRRMTQWDIKPPGYESVTAEQAKLSGMFPLPGAPRQ